MTREALLFTPPFPTTYLGMPVGLLQIATAFKKRGVSARVHDLATRSATQARQNSDVKWKDYVTDVLAQVEDPSPFVGISVMSPNLHEALDLIHHIRVTSPSSLIAVGGHHPSIDQKFLSHPESAPVNWAAHARLLCIDEFVDAVVQGLDPEAVPSVSYRKGHRIVFSGAQEMPDRALRLPDVDFSLLREHDFTFGLQRIRPYARKKQTAQISTAISCNYQCRFCVCGSIPELVFHLRDVDQRLRDLRNNSVKFVFFDDPTFTADKERARSIMRILRQSKMVWGCQTRIDCVDSGFLREMQDSGCIYVFYGIESGSDDVRRLVGKEGISNKQVRGVVRATLDSHMDVGISIIFGVPGEKPDDVQKTFALLKTLDGPIRLSPSFYAVYPGTLAARDYAQGKRSLDYWGHRYSREDVWLRFDDGYGACHLEGADYAAKIIEQLDEAIRGLNITYLP